MAEDLAGSRSSDKQTGFAAQASSGPLTKRRAVVLLLAARALRGFGDGFAVIVLPAYLAAIGLSPAQIGIVATASLLGTAVLTLGVGIIAPRFELRDLLLVGAGVVVLTGLLFPASAALLYVLVISFIGTINPSAGDIGMMVPLEHAALSREAADAERTRIFARYSLIGALSAAAGSLMAALPDVLVRYGWAEVTALQSMFPLYGLFGVLAAALYRYLPRDRIRDDTRPASTAKSALNQSRSIVYKLAALFSLDAFAGGFAVQSLLALWLFERFDMSLAAASVFFFWSSLLAAFSFPVAAWISARIGLVNTMVFTHIPSSICLIVVAFSPNLALALGLLLVRSALSQMDVPTRSSYVMAMVTPQERAAAASVTAVPRSLASAVSPGLAGFMLAGSFSGLPLLLCGALKIVYDVALLYSFRHLKPPEEQR
jgi:MFS family permease